MGMYDYIKFEHNCPKCGTKLTDWQSKNGACKLLELEPWQVSDFHTYCDNCKAWLEATVEAKVLCIVESCNISLFVDGEKFSEISNSGKQEYYR